MKTIQQKHYKYHDRKKTFCTLDFITSFVCIHTLDLRSGLFKLLFAPRVHRFDNKHIQYCKSVLFIYTGYIGQNQALLHEFMDCHWRRFGWYSKYDFHHV